jgi:prepilin-type N-terminal cleavage/methylation domain-containing protein
MSTRNHPRRAFSLVEVLIALSITGTLLAATLTALDTSFKAYKSTTESASTNVVARLVVHRVMSMIRTGTNFGPFPTDVLDTSLNPLDSTSMEFETFRSSNGSVVRITRLERRDATVAADGPYELWYVETEFTNGAAGTPIQRPLLVGVENLNFTLEYDVGPRLRRATIDLTVRANDFQDAQFASDLETPAIRLVSSAAPRRLDE